MSEDYFTTVSRSLDGTSLKYSFENVKAQELVEDTDNLGDSNRIADLASGKVLYMPSPYGQFYKWDKIAVNYGYYGASFTANPEVVLNSNPNNLGDPLSNPGRTSNLDGKVNYTNDLYPKTHIKAYIKNNRFFVNEIMNLPYDLSQGGVLENSNPNDVRHAHSAVCAWDFLNNRYSASYRNYTANSTDISHSPDPWDVADPNDPTKPGYLSDASGGDGVTLAPEHWMYFSTTPEGAIKIREKANALEPNNKGWFADGTPPPFQSLEHASAYAAIAKEYKEENQQASLVNKSNLTLDFFKPWDPLPPQPASVYNDLSYVLASTLDILEGVNAPEDYDLTSTPQVFKDTQGATAEANTNNHLVWNYWNPSKDNNGVDFDFNSTDKAILHIIPDGHVDMMINMKMKDTNGWINSCRILKSKWLDGSMVNVEPTSINNAFIGASSNVAGSWLISLECESFAITYGGWQGVNYGKIYLVITLDTSNNTVAGQCSLIPTWFGVAGPSALACISSLITVHDLDKFDKFQVSYARKILANQKIQDSISTVAKSGLDKYTLADAGPGWNSDNSKWSSGEMPPAGILVTDWLKAQKASERDVSYSFPSVALTKYEPTYQAHLRTYWANGPFIFANGQTEKNVTQIHTFTVGMKGSTASRKGKLYGTIHEGMDFKPAYHCDEVMDFSQIMVVDLSGKQLKRNYKLDGSGNPDLSGSPLRPQNLSGTAVLTDEEDYFTLEDSSFNTFLYLFQVQPYQFEIISSPPSAENDWEARYAYAPSGEMMNGDHALMIEYDPSDFSIVRTTGYNTGMPNGLLNTNNFVGYNVYSPGWHTHYGMDLVAKIGMGSAQREFMANNPGVKFQSVGVLDTRSD